MTHTYGLGDDPLDADAPAGSHWTTSNVGEAAPGVLTPLTWTIWQGAVDCGLRSAAFAMGALSASERDRTEPLTRAFSGRIAVSADFLAQLGDRMPGTSGEEIVVSAFGRVPETMRFQPTRRRWPLVAARFPLSYRRVPAQVVAMRTEYDAWWAARIAALPDMDREQLGPALAEAAGRFRRAVELQSVAVLVGVQPVFDAATRLAAEADIEDPGRLVAIEGGAEMDLVADIWEASRARLHTADVVRRHGFHGPREGELSSAVWREDDRPLRRTIGLYADRPEHDEPRALVAARMAASERAERELLAATPRARRALVRATLRQARARVPLRGVLKRSYLQAFDGCRATARRLGELLAADGQLVDPDDIFYVTLAELTAGLPEDAPALVEFRRERRLAHERVTLPDLWSGRPQTSHANEVADGEARQSVVTGVGASPGIAIGRARVVLSPDFDDVEPDEILIAPFTDPSWSSIMFVSAALVVDIGGPFSHAAIVAREMGIPCVVNTRTGTRAISTGDVVEVDGASGEVRILEPSQR